MTHRRLGGYGINLGSTHRDRHTGYVGFEFPVPVRYGHTYDPFSPQEAYGFGHRR